MTPSQGSRPRWDVWPPWLSRRLAHCQRSVADNSSSCRFFRISDHLRPSLCREKNGAVTTRLRQDSRGSSSTSYKPQGTREMKGNAWKRMETHGNPFCRPSLLIGMRELCCWLSFIRIMEAPGLFGQHIGGCHIKCFTSARAHFVNLST